MAPEICSPCLIHRGARPVTVMGLPRRVRWFILAVVALASAAMGVAFARGNLPPHGRDLLSCLFLAAVIGLARAYPVQLGPRTQVTVDSAAAFVAVMLLPPYLAISAVALGLGVASFMRPGPPLQRAFNVATGVLSVASGAAI